MLIPILGRAGSGKTTYIINKIKDTVGNGKILLIVPEQYSFEMEKLIYRSLDTKDALQVEVYSFTRLCKKIFSVYGGIAGRQIDDAAKHILMSLALDNVKDMLILYNKPSTMTAFVCSMIGIVDEFKNAGILPEKLNEFSSKTSDVKLGEKTKELSIIYQYYQSLLEYGYNDEKDSIARCCNILEGEDFFKDYTIFVDSFMTFMAAEKKFMNLMISECKDFYISLPCDNLQLSKNIDDDSDNNGTFDIAKETAMKLITNAHQMGIAVSAPIYLRNQYRLSNPALQHLEKLITSTSKEVYPTPTDAVKLISAIHPYDEIQYVAASICNLVRDEGIRYREIAVICRSMDLYSTAIEDIFSKYEIPFFMDIREDIQSIPVISFIIAAFDAIRSNYDTEYMLKLGKNSLMGLEYTDVAELENYCYIWSINHKEWIDDSGFKNNPRGLSENFTDTDRKNLIRISKTAELISTPIQRLKEKITSSTGKEFAKATYEFLLEVQAPKNMENQISKEGGEFERYINLNQAAWDILMDLLDTFNNTMEDIKVEAGRFIELFKLGIQCSDLGEIPNTLDQVLIGTADRMRPNHPKVSFVIGVNQGEFPAQLSEGGLFSDIERDALLLGGIELSPSIIKKSNYEKYFIYSAITSASEKLIISYHNTLLNGERTQKSSLMVEIEELFPHNMQTTDSFSPEYYISNKRTAFDILCKSLKNNDALTRVLFDYIKCTEYSIMLEKIILILKQNNFKIDNKKISKMLFGENMRLSPSRVEKYFLCPFSYFCSSGLNLKARRKVEFSALQSGEIIHFVLEKAVSKHGGKGLSELSETFLNKEVEGFLEEFLNDRISEEEALTKRFRYLFARLSNTLTRLLMQLGREFKQNEFEPYAFEMPISNNSEVEPLLLKTPDGISISVEGIVDRVDIMEKNQVKYIRVVDYKSGEKKFKLDDIYYGLNLQMLIYLFSIWENKKGYLKDTIPAGILYMPAKDSIITIDRRKEKDQIEVEQIKKYKMNGLLLEDQISIEGMEKKVQGIFIPAKLNKNGSYSTTSSIVSLQQLGIIKKHIEKTLLQMAENLSGGEIGANPVKGLSYEACIYCDYKSICQHQEDDSNRILKEIKKENFFSQIDGSKEMEDK